MYKYYKAISDIIKNYRIYSFQVLFYEIIFFIFYNKKFNKFEYLHSDFLSDSIPSPLLFLNKIHDFVEKKNIKQICDLGSGFGKILYYFGKVKKIKIDGVELENKIYNFSLSLQDKNINIFNENILEFNLKKKIYETLILNDPLRNKDDLLKLILKIKNQYENIYLIFINLDLNKQKMIIENLKVIDQFKASPNKNIFFCKLK